MDKLEYVKRLLNQIGMPQKQQSSLCAFALLAMAGLKQKTKWSDATNEWIRIHDIIRFISDNYGVIYAENSRETFRKQAMHPFRTAALIEDNGMPTNSPNYRYRITNEFLNVIKEIKEDSFCAAESGVALTKFVSNHESLSQIYASKKKMQKMPVRINHQDFSFSPASIMNCRRLSLKILLLVSLPIQNVCMWVIQFVKIW